MLRQGATVRISGHVGSACKGGRPLQAVWCNGIREGGAAVLSCAVRQPAVFAKLRTPRSRGWPAETDDNIAWRGTNSPLRGERPRCVGPDACGAWPSPVPAGGGML